MKSGKAGSLRPSAAPVVTDGFDDPLILPRVHCGPVDVQALIRVVLADLREYRTAERLLGDRGNDGRNLEQLGRRRDQTRIVP